MFNAERFSRGYGQSFYVNGFNISTKYCGGKLEYSISIFDNDFGNLRESVVKHVDEFIESNYTMT